MFVAFASLNFAHARREWRDSDSDLARKLYANWNSQCEPFSARFAEPNFLLFVPLISAAQEPHTGNSLIFFCPAGGDENWRSVTTVPNLLRMFNPNLIGFAVEGSDRHYGMGEPQSHDEHLLGQAKKLVARLKRDSRVDFKRHWKVDKILSLKFDYWYTQDLLILIQSKSRVWNFFHIFF